MVQIGKKIVYRDEVCTVSALVKEHTTNEDCYVLTSGSDPSLRITVPVSKAAPLMRPLMKKSDIEELLQKMPSIPIVALSGWNRGLEYKELLKEGSHESIMSIIKTAYYRQQEQAERRQKPSENDKLYFRQAERLFYNEVAAVLDMTYEQAKVYILSSLSNPISSPLKTQPN